MESKGVMNRIDGGMNGIRGVMNGRKRRGEGDTWGR